MLRGVLAPQIRPNNVISNPATAVALANQPTSTPDTGNCPTATDTRLPDEIPASSDLISRSIIDALSSGASPAGIADTLRSDWRVLDEDGTARTDLDLTGDGVPEVIFAYSPPEDGGTLLIAGCLEGRYTLRYQTVSDEPAPPEILLNIDMNRDFLTDLLFVTRACDTTLDECSYRTHLITWQPDLGRFVSLLGTTILSENPPDATDIEPDEVYELIIRLSDDGDETTGPLRTGTIIYDWNGTVYVPSIPRLDAPEYRIQLIHQADRYFAEQDMIQAGLLYEDAITDDDLEDWWDEEKPTLVAYAFYRLILARAFADDGDDQLNGLFQLMRETFPETEPAPLFVELSRLFLENFIASRDISAACGTILPVIEAQPQETLDLLNRYGNRSPTYTANDLCPF